MKKPRKKYVPKSIRYDNFSFVKAGMIKVADIPTAGLKLSIQNHVSFDEIREGRGTAEHVDALITMVNISEALAKLQLGRDWLPEIEQAQQALFELAQRGVSGKKFLFKGEELQIVQTILQLHDEQLKQCTVKTMEQAIDMVKEEAKHGRMRVISRMEYA
jgi:hypothetical protein